jgi:hypothetical protein
MKRVRLFAFIFMAASMMATGSQEVAASCGLGAYSCSPAGASTAATQCNAISCAASCQQPESPCPGSTGGTPAGSCSAGTYAYTDSNSNDWYCSVGYCHCSMPMYE